MVSKVSKETFKYFKLKEHEKRIYQNSGIQQKQCLEERHKPKASRRKEIKIREVNETENSKTEKNQQNQSLVILSIKLINL